MAAATILVGCIDAPGASEAAAKALFISRIPHMAGASVLSAVRVMSVASYRYYSAAAFASKCDCAANQYAGMGEIHGIKTEECTSERRNSMGLESAIRCLQTGRSITET